MTHRVPRFIAALLGSLGLLCCAPAFAQAGDTPQKYIGRKFWYEPEHEKYWKTKFHRVPNFDKGMFHIQKKTRFEVMALGRGWFKLRLEGSASGDPIAYIPALILRSRLYKPRITESYYESFHKASIFEEDPEIVRRRVEPAVDPAAKSNVPPPWKIRNRGFPPPGSQPPEAPAAESPKPQ